METLKKKLLNMPNNNFIILATPAPISHRTAEENLGLGYLTAVLREKGYKTKMAPIVTVDGAISYTDKEVNRPGGAIRPVIWVEIKNEF